MELRRDSNQHPAKKQQVDEAAEVQGTQPIREEYFVQHGTNKLNHKAGLTSKMAVDHSAPLFTVRVHNDHLQNAKAKIKISIIYNEKLTI